MGVTSSPFCEHKKLRTSCAACKSSAPLPVDTTLQAVPFVSADDREKAAEKKLRRASPEPRAAKADRSSGDQPGAPGVPSHEDVALKARATGPGKPLLPQRKKANRNITPAEADAVKPWWVKK